LYYRAAALWYGEGRRGRALRYALAATLIDPGYTLRRVYHQRLRGTAARQLDPSS
jgi:hypothetical protein